MSVGSAVSQAGEVSKSQSRSRGGGGGVDHLSILDFWANERSVAGSETALSTSYLTGGSNSMAWDGWMDEWWIAVRG